METLRSVKKAVKKNDWLMSIDLKDAYLHVPIHVSSRKFLRFKVAGQAYQFKVLPFGLASSPRVFTKILAPLAAKARLEGIHLFPYLDDWLVKLSIRYMLIQNYKRVQEILSRCGFLINHPKSIALSLFPPDVLEGPRLSTPETGPTSFTAFWLPERYIT